MIITPALRERFCKDCKIPINLYIEPYFSDRIDLYDDMYQSKAKWHRFEASLEKFDNEQQYFAYYEDVKQRLIDHIKNSDGYVQFNSEDMNKYRVVNSGLPAKDIYKPTFNGRTFLSIDMKQANFNALNHYSSDIFTVGEEASSCWEDFVSKFTDNDHIISSKYIRQVVLGNCNPKRHITYEKWIMDSVVSRIKELNLGEIVCFSNDELVLDLTESNFDKVHLQQVNEIVELAPVPMHINHFTLLQIIEGHEEVYAKIPLTTVDEELELKCASPHLLPMILRTLSMQSITEQDRTFLHNGLLAMYVYSSISGLDFFRKEEIERCITL